MSRQVRPAMVLFILLVLVTGIIYPLVVTSLAQLLFPMQANGSLMTQNGKIIGSELIGQDFADPKYFWGRPSATSPQPYTAFNAAMLTGSSGSNLGPLSQNLVDTVQSRAQVLRAADPTNTLPIPVDLVTASGSGLDPNISVESANYQVARVAKARGMSEADVHALVAMYTTGRMVGILGEPRVNVLLLNLALDGIK
jgi:potassium-transporting ATPase KdpC subunit